MEMQNIYFTIGLNLVAKEHQFWLCLGEPIKGGGGFSEIG